MKKLAIHHMSQFSLLLAPSHPTFGMQIERREREPQHLYSFIRKLQFPLQFFPYSSGGSCYHRPTEINHNVMCSSECSFCKKRLVNNRDFIGYGKLINRTLFESLSPSCCVAKLLMLTHNNNIHTTRASQLVQGNH